MNARSFIVTLVAIFLSIERAPAPIVEEEKATPAPKTEQSEAPKRKHSTRSTSAEQSPTEGETKTKVAPAAVAQGPARFAGTWSGKVNQGLLGHVATSLTVNSAATSVELGQNLGGGNKPATMSGNTISWKSGVAGEIHWTLTPNNDSQTAQVTMKGLMLNDTATFRRGRVPAETTHQSTAKASDEIPTAKSVPGKPGLVFSPFAPEKYVDVEGQPSGSQVKDPYSGKVFIVP